MNDQPTHVAIAVVRDGDCLLIGPRPPGTPLAGMWEFPGGKIQAGETPQAAAVRECREETGLAIRVCGKYLQLPYEYPLGRLHLHFFDCALTSAAHEARAPFRWVPRSELPQYPFPPANAELLARLTTAD